MIDYSGDLSAGWYSNKDTYLLLLKHQTLGIQTGVIEK